MALQTCKYCGLSYNGSFGADVRKHNSRHRKYHEVESALGYLPLTYTEREALKAKAYKALSKEIDAETQYSGALDLFRSHFDRSLEAAINGGYWMRHPSFEKYVAMADYPPNVIPTAIMKRIRQFLGRISREIPEGASYWYPPRSKARKQQFEESRSRHGA